MPDSTGTESPQNTSDNNSDSNNSPVSEPARAGAINAAAELQAMKSSFEVLSPLESDAQVRVVRWLLDALGVNTQGLQPLTTSVVVANPAETHPHPGPGPAEAAPTPRAFMTQKKPNSLVERIACLAYYLSFHRNMPHFKTGDLVALNTEAAAPRFGNPSRDADNADRQNGYLVTAGKGIKQITPRGEAMVDALPDREAVSTALRANPYKARRSRDTGPKRPSDRDQEKP